VLSKFNSEIAFFIKKKYDTRGDRVFSIYEEALETALQETLTLIK
jgi:hypothetical protein